MASIVEHKTTSEKDRARFKAHYEAHKQYYRQYAKNWWKTHPEKLKEKRKKAYLRKRDRILAAQRKGRLAHLEERRAANRKWQKDRWEHRQLYMRKYQQENRERLRKQAKEKYQRHKAEYWNYAQKRRALKLAATVNSKSIALYVSTIKAKKFALCYYCGSKISTTAMHFDHIVALSLGGAHSVENLCVSCPECNMSKGTKVLTRWIRTGQQLLNL